LNNKIAIQAALTRQLFSASKFAQIASIILAALLIFMQKNVIDSAVILAWGLMIVVAALLRTAIIIAYQRSDTSSYSAVRSWRIRFRLGVLVSGIVWGSASFLLYPANDPHHQLFLFCILAGLMAGALITHSADLVSAIVFGASVISPLIVHMYLAKDALPLTMAILYFTFMFLSLRGINRSVTENVVLHLEAAEREKIARISEQRYRLLLEHSPAGILHFDNNLIITYCNDRLADMLDNSAERLKGLDLNTLKDQSTLPAMKKALAGELGYYEGFYSATFSDVHRWASLTCAPSLDSEGKIVGGVAIIQDITERKLMEAALKENEERYRLNYNLLQSMLESASDVIVYALDRDYRFLAFNNKNRETFKRLWGKDIAVGMSIFDVIGDKIFGEFSRQCFDRVLAGKYFSVETREKVMKDGCLTYEYWENYGSPIRNDAGKVVGLTVFAPNITKRKEAERKLKEALVFNEGIINAIPDMLFEIDRDGHFRNIWTRIPELLASHQKTLLGNTANDVLAPESAATVMETLREAEEKELSFGKVISINLPKGTSWFELSVSRKPGSSSTDATFLMLSRDITERRRMEAELRASRNFLDSVIDSVSDPIFVKDRQHRWTLLNDAFCTFIGHPREALIGKSDYDFFPKEQADVFWEKDELTFDSKESNFNDESFTSASGEEYFIQTKKTPFVSGDGQQMLVGVIRDITASKQAEARIRELNAELEQRVLERTTQLEVINRELRDSEQRYREIFDNAVEGIYLLEVTEEGRFRHIDINPALAEATGIPREAIIGKFVDETLSEEVAADLVQKYRHCVAEGKTIVEEFILDLPAGQRNYYSTITPIYYKGRIYRLIGISRDITKLKKAERELKESREQLRGLTARREEAREEERKYIAREVHDELGQILTGLKMNVSILNHKLGAGNELTKGQVQVTMKLTDRALEVARNVASALRPSALEMGIVSALEWLAGRFSANTGIRCVVHIEDDNIQLDEAPAIALFRIVQESLTNVARHAKASLVDVTLRREASGYVMKVKDNGSGFDASKRKADSFGLVGIRERALILGGSVDIDSHPGKGTEIVVRIPVLTNAEES
jgi:PAS domain S-box-containing protein